LKFVFVFFGAGVGLEGGEDGDVDIYGRKVGTVAGADLDGGAAQTMSDRQSGRRGESLATRRRKRPQNAGRTRSSIIPSIR